MEIERAYLTDRYARAEIAFDPHDDEVTPAMTFPDQVVATNDYRRFSATLQRILALRP